MSHPAFTAEDRSFILTILANPAELTAWLIYADWLDEHDNQLQAEFLRLMARRGQLSNTQPEWYTVEERLQELRAVLEPVWVEVFDRPKIENCDAAFRFKCPKQWESLKVTGELTVRHCDACNKKVHYCHTLDDAQRHARQGDCVAVQLGVLRYPGDLKQTNREDSYVGPVDLDEGDAVMGFLDSFYEPPPPPRPWWKFW
jgi:uncharacterized protein (TIGR02996 family)